MLIVLTESQHTHLGKIKPFMVTSPAAGELVP